MAEGIKPPKPLPKELPSKVREQVEEVVERVLALERLSREELTERLAQLAHACVEQAQAGP